MGTGLTKSMMKVRINCAENAEEDYAGNGLKIDPYPILGLTIDQIKKGGMLDKADLSGYKDLAKGVKLDKSDSIEAILTKKLATHYKDVNGFYKGTGKSVVETIKDFVGPAIDAIGRDNIDKRARRRRRRR